MSEYLDRPVVEQVRAIRAGEVTSVELLDGYLERCAADRIVNAVVTVVPERARAEAVAADRAIADGRPTGALHGVPFTVKDALGTAGVRSTGGAVEGADHVPGTDATAVRRLRGAGAVLFGKTNTPRWCADVQTYNELFGTTNNPHDPRRTSGGSSGGSAAAVAAGLTAFDLGTDIGGSIRVPAAFCGVVGHKPSYGVVPADGYLGRAGGCVVDQEINVVGPIARSADDLALLLDVLAGPDDARAVAWQLRLTAPKPLAACRVAIWTDDGPSVVDDAQRTLIGRLGSALREAGIDVLAAHPPVDAVRQGQLWWELATTTSALSVGDPAAAARRAGAHIDWLRRQDERQRLIEIWAAWFESVDLLVCPVWPGPAFAHDHGGSLRTRSVRVDGVDVPHTEAMRWPGMVGVVGLPATAVPIGTIDGLPLGVQVVGPYLHDRRTIAAAATIERLDL